MTIAKGPNCWICSRRKWCCTSIFARPPSESPVDFANVANDRWLDGWILNGRMISIAIALGLMDEQDSYNTDPVVKSGMLPPVKHDWEREERRAIMSAVLATDLHYSAAGSWPGSLPAFEEIVRRAHWNDGILIVSIFDYRRPWLLSLAAGRLPRIRKRSIPPISSCSELPAGCDAHSLAHHQPPGRGRFCHVHQG